MRATRGILGVLIAASAVACEAAPLTVRPLSVDGLAALEMEVSIDGGPAGRMRARVKDAKEEPKIALPLPAGFHRYAVRGQAEMEDGRRLPITGAGFVTMRDEIQRRLEDDAARRDPLAAFEAVLAECRTLGVPRLPRLVRGTGRPGPDALLAAEKRLGVRLPETYRRLIGIYGPFTVIGRGDEGEEPQAALYAPEEIASVPAWRRAVRKAPLEAGDTPKAQARVARLERDFVIGHTFDTVWTIRAGTHPPCPDGTPSLSGEFLYAVDPAEDLWVEGTDSHEGYFGDVNARCTDRTGIFHANAAAVFVDTLSTAVALVRDGGTRVRESIAVSKPGALVVTLGED